MTLNTTITRSLLALGLAVTPALAHADTFTWNFAAPNVSGTGTLTAVAYGNPGEFLITGGTGTVTDSQYGNVPVTFNACATPDATCTLVNTDGAGANLTYDNLLFPSNPVGAQLDDNGIVLAFAPPGTAITGLGVYDGPSQEFYAYTPNGYQNLTTPFTVTPFVAATPEPSTLVLVGSSILGVYTRFKRRNS